MADPKTIAIGTKEQKLEFQVPQPYSEGHKINAVEANVLNQTMAENIGNNFRARVQATLTGAEGAMSESDLRAAFDDYASKYEFTLASAGGGRSTMTPLERECRKLAKGIVTALLTKEGRKVKEVEKEAFEAEVARYAATEPVQKAAAKNLKAADALFEQAVAAAA